MVIGWLAAWIADGAWTTARPACGLVASIAAKPRKEMIASSKRSTSRIKVARAISDINWRRNKDAVYVQMPATLLMFSTMRHASSKRAFFVWQANEKRRSNARSAVISSGNFHHVVEPREMLRAFLEYLFYGKYQQHERTSVSRALQRSKCLSSAGRRTRNASAYLIHKRGSPSFLLARVRRVSQGRNSSL